MALTDFLPEPLTRLGPLGLTWGQWIALPVLLLTAWILGFVVARLTRMAFGVLVRRTSATWDDRLVEGLGGPLTLAWAVAAAHALMLVVPADPVGKVVFKTLQTTLFLAFFWFLLRVVTLLGSGLATSSWAMARPATRSLLPLAARVLQVAVIAMAAVAILADLGYPVASLVAGLGIGGLALALAGQKTIENLFGAFSIGVDQPFRVGDFVNVEGLLGTVELIGLRSTRIRTLDRTVVTIPNGKLAEMRLETFALRDRIRLHCVLGVVYGTAAAQMREILSGCERVLRQHPKTWQETVVVRFQGYGASSMDIEIMSWFETNDFNVFRDCRQEVLLGFMEVVEGAGSSFALPTRTVHLVQERPVAAPGRG